MEAYENRMKDSIRKFRADLEEADRLLSTGKFSLSVTGQGDLVLTPNRLKSELSDSQEPGSDGRASQEQLGILVDPEEPENAKA
jgi:hypothetical protein